MKAATPRSGTHSRYLVFHLPCWSLHGHAAAALPAALVLGLQLPHLHDAPCPCSLWAMPHRLGRARQLQPLTASKQHALHAPRSHHNGVILAGGAGCTCLSGIIHGFCATGRQQDGAVRQTGASPTCWAKRCCFQRLGDRHAGPQQRAGADGAQSSQQNPCDDRLPSGRTHGA